MNSDSIFYIGKSHKVCQDYACTFNTEISISDNLKSEIVGGMVADGCSSSDDTDFGSRLLCKMACKEFGRSPLSLDLRNIAFSAKNIADYIPYTSDRCLDSTLLLVYAHGYLCKATICGDGAIARLRKDKMIDVISVEYKSGAPLYLSYLFNIGWAKRYLSAFEYEKVITTYTIKPNGEIIDKAIVKETNLDENDPMDLAFRVNEDFIIDDTECVAVMTDGVNSFYKTKKEDTSIVLESIPQEEIIKQVMAVKTYAGQFIQRRINKARKEFDKANWVNSDDFSVAAVYLGE